MPDVSLVYLPYGALERPSLALSILKACLMNASIEVELEYTNFTFAEAIGSNLYPDMVWVRNEMIGEWTFAGAAFPDFQPDSKTYLDRIIEVFAPDNEKTAAYTRQLLLRIRQKAQTFIDQTARRIVSKSPKIVACSSTFNQHCAALALSRRLKELEPTIITIIGGANCEGEMGLATVQLFPWVDYVFSGESDDNFAPFCKLLLQQGADLPLADLPYGVFRAVHRNQSEPLGSNSNIPRRMIDNLDSSPIPDYGDYFKALSTFKDRDKVVPGLLIETSRGCWWGMKNHCTFCGLNGDGISYRSKSPKRAISEFKYLSQTYGINRFLVVDNILDMSYFKEVLPALASDSETYQIFYEIKANLSYEQLCLLKQAGVTWLQPGIEGLHDEVLKLMNKGTRTWVNVQLLKWARELGLSLAWNILCGFPQESDDWYEEVAAWVPLIEHLQPPTELRPIRFDRFSVYQSDPERYGLELQPAWPYHYIYPVNDTALAKLVYQFEAVDRQALRTNPLRLETAGSLPSLGGVGRDRLQDQIKVWHRAFLSPLPPILGVTETEDATVILDTRTIAPVRRTTLRGVEHRVYRACYECKALKAIVKAVNRDGGPSVTIESVGQVLDELIERKLVLKFGDRYLGLAVRGDYPSLPCSHREGYPGGWIRLEKTKPNRPSVNTSSHRSVAESANSLISGNFSQSIQFSEPLLLDCGQALSQYSITFETYGTLSSNRDNAILICHPLTKNAHVAGLAPGSGSKPGWWDSMVGSSKTLDTDKYFIICSNVLGGSGGSTGPASINPVTSKPFGMTFPFLTVTDMVRAQHRLIQSLGIDRLFAVVGGCFGGQQALEWSIQYPRMVKNAIVISTTAWTSAHTIAIFNCMQRLICADPNWNQGDYYDKTFPMQGIAHAMAIAIPLWMSRELMEKKFGRCKESKCDNNSFETGFAVEAFLDQVAERIHQKHDPNSLLYLMRSMKCFDLKEEYGTLEQALAPIQAQILLISYRSDWRYPPQEVQRIYTALNKKGGSVKHAILDSPVGHGAFVYDPQGCASEISSFLTPAMHLAA